MTLDDILKDASKRARVLSDASALLDAEVARKSGFSGLTVKTGFAAMKAIKPGIVPAAIDMLLPAFAPALEPFFAEGQRRGNVAGWFAAQAPAVADALLNVTDEKAKVAKNAMLRKTYQSLRSTAHQHTSEAMPGLGRMLAGYV
jgi:hypothetical protein